MFILSFVRKNLQARAARNAAFLRLKQCRNGDWPEDTRAWINEHLDHPDWEVRNVAVKLVGLGGFQTWSDGLITRLLNPSEPGFIRRNSAIALRRLEHRDSAVLKALRDGLDDPYWEVRTESALGLMQYADPDSELADLLIRRIYRNPPDSMNSYPIVRPLRIYREKNFEVRAALLRALGSVLDDTQKLRALEIPLMDDLWKVREAALEAYVRAALRLNVDDQKIQDTLSGLDLTCTEFKPTFPIRESYNRLMHNIRDRSTEDPAGVDHAV